MAGMRRQARIEDTCNAGCWHNRVASSAAEFGLCPHAQVQRPQPAQQQPCLEGSEDRAMLRAHGLDAVPRFARPRRRERARDHVGVTVEILRRGMHHDVGAERDRLSEDRRRDGRIDREQCARRVGGLGHRGNIGDGPERIARGLDVHQTGFVRLNRGADRIEVRTCRRTPRDSRTAVRCVSARIGMPNT